MTTQSKGKSQRQESRVLTHDSINGDKLYINTVLQPYIPTVPTGKLKASNVMQIGYADTEVQKHSYMEVNLYEKTQQQVTDEASLGLP